MTQRDLAAKLSKPPSYVGKIEAIERNLSALELIEWTNALGVKAADILKNISDV